MKPTKEPLTPHQDEALSSLLADVRSEIESLSKCAPLAPTPNWKFLAPGDGEGTGRRRKLWRAASAFADRAFPLQLNWLDNLKLEFRHPSETAQQLFVHGDFDPNEFVFLDSFLRKGMTVVDVGANSGLYATYAARKVGPAGAVVAFEPSKREFATLTRNIANNELSNVSAFPLAVGAASGEAILSIAPDAFDGHNSVHGLSLTSQPPNIRYSFDGETYHWRSFGAGHTRIAIPDAQLAELYIYSESPFSIDLRQVRLDPTGVVAGANTLALAHEFPIEPPAIIPAGSLPCAVSIVGDVTIQPTPEGVRAVGAAGAGIAFRWLLNPDPNASIVLVAAPSRIGDLPSEKVRVVSLDSFLMKRNLSSLDFIKLDVEGGESDALLGARQLIEKFKPVIMAEIATSGPGSRPENVAACADFFATAGYDLFDLSTGALRPIVLGQEHGSNIVAMPKKAGARAAK